MITNDDVARTLERIGDLLEIKGENPFKVRAYRLAATQVENLGDPLSKMAQREGGLQGIEGFGPAIAEKVGELLTTGRLAFLERLEHEIPPTLVAVRQLPGVGPRTAAMLWREAGITTLDELDAAARTGKLVGLPRLGQRGVERIVRALEQRNGSLPARRARTELEPLATRLLEAVASLPQVRRAELAGSYRRRRDTIGDLDIVTATPQPSIVITEFAALPLVELVLARGETKCSVEMDGGFQVDCRAVAVDEFGAALQYFTGSQAHNVQLRGRALRMGMTLNEYGLFRLDGGARVAGNEEADVYGALGLQWIPPEHRQGRGEIEAAALDSEEVHAVGRPAARTEV